MLQLHLSEQGGPVCVGTLPAILCVYHSAYVVKLAMPSLAARPRLHAQRIAHQVLRLQRPQ